MRAVVAVVAVIAVVAVSRGCAFFGGPVPCAGDANCPGDLVCRDAICVVDDGPEPGVGRCGIASSAVVDASLPTDDAPNRRFRTIRAAVAAVTTSATPEPCIDILAGTYTESAALTLPPGTVLKGDNTFQRGTQQTVIFSRVDDAVTGLLVTRATIDGLRFEGTGTLIAAVDVDVDVDFSIVDSTITNGGGVIFDTEQALRLSIDNGAIVQGALTVDSPVAIVDIGGSLLDRSRIRITRGTSVTITGGEIVADSSGLQLSTSDTRLVDVSVRSSSPSTVPCDAAITIAGGAALFTGVRVEGFFCPAISVTDELAVVTAVVLGVASQNQDVRFDSNDLDLVVNMTQAGSVDRIDAREVGTWSIEPECGVAACVCDTTSSIDTDDGACADRCLAFCEIR